MEAQYYEYLKSLTSVRKIELQPKRVLIPSFEKLGIKYQGMRYTPDFLVTYKDGTSLLVEIKGFAKTDALMRRKLFEFFYREEKLVWIIGTKMVKGRYTEWRDYFEYKKERRKKK